MLKQLMINKKLEQARNTLNEYLEEENKLVTRSEELEAAIEEAETDEEVAVVEEEVKDLEKEKSELEEKKSKLEGEIAELEEELEELNSKKPNNNERKNEGENKMEIKEAINNYVRTKHIREIEGFKVVDGGILVPDELMAPIKEKEDKVNLLPLVKRVPVKRGGGTYPFIKKSGSKFTSVKELEKNPELAKPEITEKTYTVDTYRGYIPVSQEVIDDADYDITGLIAEEIADQEFNTINEAIATVLKTATPKTVTGLDGLKKVFNVDLKRIYARKAIISASLYNVLDTLKDENGRYLLQDNITVASGKTLFGNEVIVLDDDVIGTTAGDLVGFIGDPKEFATFFDRKQASVKWIEHNIYGQLLAGYVRFGVEVMDEDAGFYITFTPDTIEA